MKAIVMFIACMLFTSHAHAAAVSGTVTWQAVGNPGFLRINGTGGKVDGVTKDDGGGKVSGVFKVALADFKTGLELRDKHMKETFLQVAKFPFATLTLDPVAATEAEFRWTGKLELKGQVAPVSGTATVKGGKLSASFTVSVKDYPAIGNPSHMGVTMAEVVNVTVEGDVK